MTDDSPVGDPIVDVESDPRLALRPDPPPRVEGAWWPRTTELATELPGLITGLSDQLGQIDLVGYHLDAWTATPPHLELDGQTVELHGVSSDEPNSVILIGEGRHLVLLVIPPDADEQAARQQLTATAEPGAGDTAIYSQVVTEVAARLARHEGSDDPERVEELERWGQEAAQHFVDAQIQAFVPILIENLVRNRIERSRAATTS